MATPRDTWNYTLKDGREHVYKGVTNDPASRAAEHQQDGKRFTHMVIDGPARTRDSAERKETEDLERYRRNHAGENPKYNVKKDG